MGSESAQEEQYWSADQGIHEPGDHFSELRKIFLALTKIKSWLFLSLCYTLDRKVMGYPVVIVSPCNTSVPPSLQFCNGKFILTLSLLVTALWTSTQSNGRIHGGLQWFIVNAGYQFHDFWQGFQAYSWAGMDSMFKFRWWFSFLLNCIF
jgi:hypothetical protein